MLSVRKASRHETARMPSAHRRPLVTLVGIGAFAIGACGLGGAAAMDVPGASTVEHVVTALAEVQGGSVDGMDYLSIAIAGEAVGPLRCRGTSLRADTSPASTAEARAAMEHVALAALLNAETVLVTVPLAPGACRDGQPTFTRLDLLPASP